MAAKKMCGRSRFGEANSLSIVDKSRIHIITAFPGTKMSDFSSLSKGKSAPQASPGRTKSRISTALVAGIGGVVTVLAVAVVMMAGSPMPQPASVATAPSSAALMQSPVATLQSAPASSGLTDRCEVRSLALLFNGTGVVRIHSGSYLSPPIQLTQQYQRVTFPAPGSPQAGEGTITVEGITQSFGFSRIENEPAGTVLLGKRGEPERSYSLGHGLYLIAVGWNLRNSC
jgi:hypothetical protein